MVGLVVADHDRGEPIEIPSSSKAILHPVLRRPGVDEDRVAVGRIQQDRVALADVEDAHASGRPAECSAEPAEPNGQAGTTAIRASSHGGGNGRARAAASLN